MYHKEYTEIPSKNQEQASLREREMIVIVVIAVSERMGRVINKNQLKLETARTLP
jgi:hypothetical protein